jgi:hypothetical protein
LLPLISERADRPPRRGGLQLGQSGLELVDPGGELDDLVFESHPTIIDR